MNKSIIAVAENTLNEKVRQFAEMLISNRNRQFRCEFTKKDGSVRTMRFVPRTEHHEVMGYDTTAVGRNIVRGKVKKDMIVVNEIYTPTDVVGCHDCVRPRTINLAKVISLTFA